FLTLTNAPPKSTPFPYTTLFRSDKIQDLLRRVAHPTGGIERRERLGRQHPLCRLREGLALPLELIEVVLCRERRQPDDLGADVEDRKSTRLNSSHVKISYAVFCL